MTTASVAKAARLRDFRRNVYSENGEDGLLAEIMRRLDIRRGWFCEFGAWDGRYGSNCYNLLRRGWSGVMIEGKPSRYAVLQRLAARHPGALHALCSYIGPDAEHPDSLDKVLSRTPIPAGFDLLSVDIDGLDYQVWRSLALYRPTVVVIEINSSFPPGVHVVHGRDGEVGSSFTAMVELGRAKGYEPVAHTGNLVFVRRERIADLGLSPEEVRDADRLFTADWVAPTRLGTLRRKIGNMTPQRALVKLQNLVRGERADF